MQRVIDVRGIKLETDPRVWTPSIYAKQFLLILERLDLVGKRVLDFGSGSGVLAICCALRGASCVGVDINPHAVRLAMTNGDLNGVEIEFVESDRFEALRGREGEFDLIVANTPSSPGRDAADRNRHTAVEWNENGGGREILDAVIMDGRRFVCDNGALLSCTSSEQDHAETDRLLHQFWSQVEILKTVDYRFDTPGLERFAESWLRENRIRRIAGEYWHEVRYFLASVWDRSGWQT